MPKKQTASVVAYHSLVASGVLWGFVALFYKQGLAALSISVFLMLRFAIGAATLYVWQRKKFKILSQKLLIIVGLFALVDAVAVNYVYSFAIQKTSMLHASIILLTTPFFVYFFAALLLKEKPHRLVLIGSGVAVGGLAVILFGNQAQSGQMQNTAIGDLVMLGYSLLNAFTIVLGRKLLAKKKQIAPEQMAFLEYSVAAVVISGIVLATGTFSEVMTISAVTWFWISAAAIIGGALPILLYYRSVKRLPAERLADINFISPAVAGVVGVVFLGEQLSTAFVVGTSLVVVGLLIGHNKLHPIVTAHKIGADVTALERIFAAPKKAYQYISVETRKFGQ